MTWKAPSPFALAVIILLLMVHRAAAQIELLAPDELAQYQQRLPQAISVAPPPMTLYLQDLQRRQASAADERQKAVLTRKVANAVRVAEALKGSKSSSDTFFAHFAVPAMSEMMRLPDAYPIDGRFAGDVGIVAAQDEYEPASFVIYPFASVERVELTVSDLKAADGMTFPKENLDLKVVKVWYQGGNGWFSYFTDVGLQLVPELLLKDENLIKVDTEQQANYARVDEPAGAKYVWISQPKKIDTGFDPYASPFADAKTLQPVSLEQGRFKQFFLTAHVARDAKPGIYRGSITVKAAGQQPGQIPVALRVLPFQLPLPKTNYDINKDFVVHLMGAWPRIGPDHKAFMPTLLNLRRHNMLHVGPGAQLSTPPDVAEKMVRAMKEAGFATKPIIGGNMPGWVGTHDGTPLSFDELMITKRAARDWRAFMLKHFGHTDAAISHGDEQAAPWVIKTRPLWRILHEHGLKTNLAGHDHIFARAGYAMDMHPTAGSPADAHQARKWKAMGHGYVGFYANQHNGSENPAFVRRQHGLLGYLSDFDMINNYEFAYGPWNDRAIDVYKPMVLAYPTSEGLVDTLAWEGFREAIDDIRYATKLRQLADEAIASDSLDRIYVGRQVRQWFALMDGTSVDLDAVRMEMIEKIERLQGMVAR